MVKVTFTVDEQTVETLRQISARMNKPQSAIFREAIKDYADRADKLRADERDRLLAALDRMRARKPSRSQAEVDAEITEIRAIRRLAGRRTRAK
jgi:predicted transcriptional regulator